MTFVSSSVIKISLKYGVIGAILFSGLFIGLFLTGTNPYLIAPDFDLLLIPIFVFFPLYEFRLLNHKKMEYTQGVTIGLLTILCLSIITSIFIFIFHIAVNQDQLTEFVDLSLKTLEENKQKVTEEMDIDSYEKTKTRLVKTEIGTMVLDNFLKKNIIGLLLTVMISIILRKSDKKKDGK